MNLILIIGKYGDSKCKKILDNIKEKDIPYRYLLWTELTESQQEYYTELAEKNKKFRFPLLIKDGILLTEKDI